MSEASQLRELVANVLVARYEEPELRALLVALLERPSGLGALIVLSNRPEAGPAFFRQNLQSVAQLRAGEVDLGLQAIVRVGGDHIRGEVLDRTIAYLGLGDGLALQGMRELIRLDPVRGITALQTALDTGLRGRTLATALKLPRRPAADAVADAVAQPFTSSRGSVTSYLARFFEAIASRPHGMLALMDLLAPDFVDWAEVDNRLGPISAIKSGAADLQLSDHAHRAEARPQLIAQSRVTQALIRVMAESDVDGGDAATAIVNQELALGVGVLVTLGSMNIRGPQLAAAWRFAGQDVATLQRSIEQNPRRVVDAVNQEMGQIAFPQAAIEPPVNRGFLLQ